MTNEREGKMWVNKPKLSPNDKIRVRKMFYRAESEPEGRMHWTVILPLTPTDRDLRRYSFYRYERWEDAHRAAFTINDYGGLG